MKEIFSLKIIIFLFLISSFFFTNSLFAENYKFGIKNFCNKVSIKDLLKNKIKINYIEIKIQNTRNWYKNILRAVTRNDPSITRSIGVIEKKRKKKFNANLILNYPNNKNCAFKSRIRIHGDLADHIRFDDGLPITSMHVRLLEGNINNVTKFKLFLPRARHYMNEIFITSFFKHLNYLSPRTSVMKVKINDKFYNYIFQEHIAKELLENNNFVEGPILEGHENFENNFGKLKGHENFENDFTNEARRLTRISNFKWASKGNDELNSSIKAIGNLNNIVLMNNFYKLNDNELNILKELIVNPNILFLQNEKTKNKNLAYESLMYALDATHGLDIENRRFYYDHIYSALLPIYYDGTSHLFFPHGQYVSQNYEFNENSNNSLNKEFVRKFEKIPPSTKIGAPIALNLVRKINKIKLKEELNINGFNINLNELNAALELIEQRLKKIETLEEYKIKPINLKEPYYSFFKYEKEAKIIFYKQNDKTFYQCPANSTGIKQCTISRTKKEKIPFLLNQENLNIKNKENIFVSNNINNYFSNEFKEEPNILAWKHFDLDKVSLVSSGNSAIKIDQQEKKIFLQAHDPSSRIVFFGGTLENWRIEFDGGLSNFEYTRKINGLTGCLTFLDVEVINIELDLKNAKCEDSVNFIRSKGTIKNIKINNSFSDAFDADFSELEIKNITIRSAQNDCLDFSFGDYKIENANIFDCGDKAISFGEQSTGNINEVNIDNSIIGIASKDSSIVKINRISNVNSTVCLTAYRKKQEFYGGLILYNELNCNATVPIHVEPGSHIENVSLNEF